jgi:replication-associated recombination protein RarA
VKQEYLPEKVKSRIYYRPTGRGFEKAIKARIEEINKKKE